MQTELKLSIITYFLAFLISEMGRELRHEKKNTDLDERNTGLNSDLIVQKSYVLMYYFLLV